MFDFVINAWFGSLFECGVLWSDDHNDIGFSC
jgi:hypothetical protein